MSLFDADKSEHSESCCKKYSRRGNLLISLCLVWIENLVSGKEK